AQAVFKVGGMMCEPATHRAWARRTMARQEVFGVVGEAARTNAVTAMQPPSPDQCHQMPDASYTSLS
ncbi:MAG: HpcH/HpaI aldolase/citrate lyase family protein, partial [Pseudomonadota bacterium]